MSNKNFSKSIQNTLKELGHTVPLGHVYEALSKASGYKSYNVAAAKKADFNSIARPKDAEYFRPFVDGNLNEFGICKLDEFKGQVVYVFDCDPDDEDYNSGGICSDCVIGECGVEMCPTHIIEWGKISRFWFTNGHAVRANHRYPVADYYDVIEPIPPTGSPFSKEFLAGILYSALTCDLWMNRAESVSGCVMVHTVSDLIKTYGLENTMCHCFTDHRDDDEALFIEQLCTWCKAKGIRPPYRRMGGGYIYNSSIPQNFSISGE